jgi:hypothetical protein
MYYMSDIRWDASRSRDDRVARHEAAHAIVAIQYSYKRPLLATIEPCKSHEGVVVCEKPASWSTLEHIETWAAFLVAGAVGEGSRAGAAGDDKQLQDLFTGTFGPLRRWSAASTATLAERDLLDQEMTREFETWRRKIARRVARLLARPDIKAAHERLTAALLQRRTIRGKRAIAAAAGLPLPRQRRE